MSEQIKSGDIVRFAYTGNRYRVEMIANGARLEPIGEITGIAAGKLSLELLRMLIEDGIIEREGNDG